MSSASPVRILEDDTLDLDLMFSYDLFLECSNTNMNDLDNDDFAFAISSIAQHECLNLKIPTEGSPDGSPAGTNQPLEDTAQIDGGDNVWQPENDIAGLPPMVEEFLDAPSSWNPMYNSSLTLPDHSNEYNHDTIDLFTKTFGLPAMHGQSQDQSATTPMQKGVDILPPESQLWTTHEPEACDEGIQEATRKRKRPAQLSHEQAVCEDIHGGYRNRKEKAKPIPEERWDLMKPHITDCYITEGKTMKQVKEMLESKFQHLLEHCGGKVEEKQILDHLKKWKIQKYVRPRQREYIIQKFLERVKMEGKRPLKFFVRGVEVSPNKVERWLKSWMKTRQDSGKGEGKYEYGTSVASGVFCKTVSEISFKNLTLGKNTPNLPTLIETLPSLLSERTPGDYTISNAGRSNSALKSPTIEPWDQSEQLESFLLRTFSNILFVPCDTNHVAFVRVFTELVLSSQTYRPWLELVQKFITCASRSPCFDRIGTRERWTWEEKRSHVVLRTITYRTVSQTSESYQRIMVFVVIDSIENQKSLCAWVDITVDSELSCMQQKRVFTCNHAGGSLHHDSMMIIRDDNCRALEENIKIQQATPNDGWSTQSSSLRIASFNGQYETTHLLLKQGAIVENGTDDSCVLWSIWEGCFQHMTWSLESFEHYRRLSDLVIQYGAYVPYCVNATCDKGNLLHLPASVFSCLFGDHSYEFSKILIRYFIDIGCDLEYRNAYGYTPLMHAVSRNVWNSARGYISALLDNGANVHATDHEQRGCFRISIAGFSTLACYNNPTIDEMNALKTLWRILMKAGCDPWTTDSSGKTAMDYICHDNVRAEVLSFIEGCWSEFSHKVARS